MASLPPSTTRCDIDEAGARVTRGGQGEQGAGGAGGAGDRRRAHAGTRNIKGARGSGGRGRGSRAQLQDNVDWVCVMSAGCVSCAVGLTTITINLFG